MLKYNTLVVYKGGGYDGCFLWNVNSIPGLQRHYSLIKGDNMKFRYVVIITGLVLALFAGAWLVFEKPAQEIDLGEFIILQ